MQSASLLNVDIDTLMNIWRIGIIVRISNIFTDAHIVMVLPKSVVCVQLLLLPVSVWRLLVQMTIFAPKIVCIHPIIDVKIEEPSLCCVTIPSWVTNAKYGSAWGHVTRDTGQPGLIVFMTMVMADMTKKQA